MNVTGRPLLLDLYCKAGGTSRGYQMAGFYVVGVDIESQKNYIGDDFLQADALEVLRILIGGGCIIGSRNSYARHASEGGRVYHLEDFTLIAASPPCQKYARTKNLKTSRKDHPDLVGPTRELLLMTGKPYVIENVQGAPLINPLRLCGTMFNLGTIRHRLFECNPPIWFPPAPCQHDGKIVPMWWKSRQRALLAGGTYKYIHVVGSSFLMPEAREAMGINWMIRDEISQAIPPAYCEYIGKQMLLSLS